MGKGDLMKIVWVLLFFLSTIFSCTLECMEAWALDSNLGMEGKGKEKVRERSASLDSQNTIDDQTEKREKELVVKPKIDPSLQAMLNSPSQRRRVLSLSLNKSNTTPIARKQASKHRSIETLFRTDSEFEVQQGKMTLFDLLSKSIYDDESFSTNIVDELEAWINITCFTVPHHV